MNWSYIRNTSPNYWRYQGPIFVLTLLFSYLGIWGMFEEPNAVDMPMVKLSVFGAVALSTFQVTLVFVVFHIVIRGIYKHFKPKLTSKRKVFANLAFASFVSTAIIIFFDLLPIYLGILPYNAEDYLTSFTYQDDFSTALILYYISNWASTLVWAGLYALMAGISNYKQLALLLKKQELQILTNRVNPEFLFDTMQVIKQQIDIDEEKAADLVTKASDLFRYNLLSSKSADAKLKDEIGSLKNYLELLNEQNKAPESHNIVLHDEETAPSIPSMTLIFICSFLQNSARNRHGALQIVGFIKHHKYRIEIAHQSHGKWLLDTEHFDNVKTRLEHLYGKKASIVLIKKGKNRKVIIELPIDWQELVDTSTSASMK